MYDEEKKMITQEVNELEKFTKEVYDRLMNFDLKDQNEALCYLHNKTKDDRLDKLNGLAKETEQLSVSIKELDQK